MSTLFHVKFFQEVVSSGGSVPESIVSVTDRVTRIIWEMAVLTSLLYEKWRHATILLIQVMFRQNSNEQGDKILVTQVLFNLILTFTIVLKSQ